MHNIIFRGRSVKFWIIIITIFSSFSSAYIIVSLLNSFINIKNRLVFIAELLLSFVAILNKYSLLFDAIFVDVANKGSRIGLYSLLFRLLK